MSDRVRVRSADGPRDAVTDGEHEIKQRRREPDPLLDPLTQGLVAG